MQIKERVRNLFGRARRRLEVTKELKDSDGPRKYLFVYGTGRSGTTLTAELLGTHEDIAIGIERYSRWDENRLGPRLFSKKRFFNYRFSDTFPEAISMHRDHYEKAREKFEHAVYVGDKLPNLLDVSSVDRNFSGATFIFCYRNIYEVAASWNARATDPDDHLWSPHMNHLLAPSWWTESIRSATAAKNAGRNILLCNYNALTDPLLGETYYRGLLDALGLLVAEGNLAQYREMIHRQSKARSEELSEAMRSEIADRLDHQALEEFEKAFGVELRSAISPPSSRLGGGENGIQC